MAIVGINYDCGCGFHAKTIEEAMIHSDKEQHMINVAGSIKPSTARPLQRSRLIDTSSYSRTPSNLQTHTERTAVITPLDATLDLLEEKADFSTLRDRLKKK